MTGMAERFGRTGTPVATAVATSVVVLAVVASLLTTGRASIALSLVAGFLAAFTLGRSVEARRAAAAPAPAARRHDVVNALGISLARCRRFERPLTLVRIGGPIDPVTQRTIADAVRLTDEVCHEADASYVLMPEESVIGATAWVRRLAETVDLPTVAVAQFPVDGLTVDGLLDHTGTEGAALEMPRAARSGDLSVHGDQVVDRDFLTNDHPERDATVEDVR